ncbi:MAG: hypothetical protein WA395_15280 [Nitrososphaeraceae archaeon]|jgi:hypothetical protein
MPLEGSATYMEYDHHIIVTNDSPIDLRTAVRAIIIIIIRENVKVNKNSNKSLYL